MAGDSGQGRPQGGGRPLLVNRTPFSLSVGRWRLGPLSAAPGLRLFPTGRPKPGGFSTSSAAGKDTNRARPEPSRCHSVRGATPERTTCDRCPGASGLERPPLLRPLPPPGRPPAPPWCGHLLLYHSATCPPPPPPSPLPTPLPAPHPRPSAPCGGFFGEPAGPVVWTGGTWCRAGGRTAGTGRCRGGARGRMAAGCEGDSGRASRAWVTTLYQTSHLHPHPLPLANPPPPAQVAAARAPRPK
jgi:hypothetical protein